MSNPILSESRWSEIAKTDGQSGVAMTVDGAVTKTVLLLAVMLAVMVWMFATYWHAGVPVRGEFLPFMIGGAITGLVMCLINVFAPRWAMATSLIYAAAEGLLVGGITMLVQAQYPGLPLLAACFTAATLLGMLLLYRTGIIKASSGLVRGVMAATAGLFLGVGLLWLLSAFGVGGGIISTLYGNGPIGIGFSVLCIGLAAFNLVVDFAFIEQGAQQRLPKYMEWVGAFALLVTLVWLYIEILRLLSKLRR